MRHNLNLTSRATAEIQRVTKPRRKFGLKSSEMPNVQMGFLENPCLGTLSADRRVGTKALKIQFSNFLSVCVCVCSNCCVRLFDRQTDALFPLTGRATEPFFKPTTREDGRFAKSMCFSFLFRLLLDVLDSQGSRLLLRRDVLYLFLVYSACPAMLVPLRVSQHHRPVARPLEKD